MHVPPLLSSPRARSRGLAALLLAVAGLVPAAVSSLTAAPERINVGILRFDDRPDGDAALDGIREGLALARMEPFLVERHARGDGDAALRALQEMRIENVDVVFAIGPEAAQRARDGFRRGAVVYTAVAEPDALGLTGAANACGTASDVGEERLLDELLRLAPDGGPLGVFVPRDDRSAEALFLRLDRAAEARGKGVAPPRRATRVVPEGAGDDQRAVHVARSLPDGVRVLFVPPDVRGAQVKALAGALAGRGVALVGSRAEHLARGCSAVLRTDARSLGALAVVQAKKVLDGASPATVPVRRATRVRVEVDLNHAAALDVGIAPTVIAGADRVVGRLVRSPR